MADYSRRDFLKIGTALAASAGLSPAEASAMTAGLRRFAEGHTRVCWVQGQSCSGCSVSLLNSDRPGPLEVLTEYISLVFHQNVGAAQGNTVASLLETIEEAEDYVLVVEGAIPLGMPEACTIAGKPLTELLPPLIEKAAAVVAVGTCAAFGGIPGAEGNPTGAGSVRDLMEKQGMKPEGKLLNCPSCPTHPSSVVGTLAYVAGRGYPPVHPTLLTPQMFYSSSTHDDCPRFHYYSKHIFADRFGDDEGCLFKLGCLGPLTFTECPRRQWNGGVNWCIRAGAPCIGCSYEGFARRRDFPFYRKGEKYHEVAYVESERQERAS